MSFCAQGSPTRKRKAQTLLSPRRAPPTSPRRGKAKAKAKGKAAGGAGGKKALDHDWREHLTPEEDPLVPADVKRAKNRARRINAEKAMKSSKGMKWIHALFIVCCLLCTVVSSL